MQRELMSHNMTDRVGIENYNLHIFSKGFYAYNFSSTKKIACDRHIKVLLSFFITKSIYTLPTPPPPQPVPVITSNFIRQFYNHSITPRIPTPQLRVTG